jgi:Na+:H+ antiporter, NhaA family
MEGSEHAPEAWPGARRFTRRVLRPLERFLRVEAASGIVLLAATLVAVVWANSPWRSSYEHLWHTRVSFGVGAAVFERSLHFWINEGLMAVFFFVVGLEIRRELHQGELADPKRAALPVAAALGGMIAPALIFLVLNGAPATRRGWGVPTATDIAFAVGVLALLGKRVPPALRVLLLALAIIDDIGAIVVIALFYSSGIVAAGLAIAAAGVASVWLLQRFGVRSPFAYFVPGAVIWFGVYRAGVHPTIAGVVVGLLTPVRTWFGEQGFLRVTRDAIHDLRHRASRDGHGSHDLLATLHTMRLANREAVSPVVRLQAVLHPWVAFGIMPLFALANAGVDLRGVQLEDAGAKSVALGVVLGLVLGKPIGILAASFATVRLGLCALPKGVHWSGVLLVGAVAGIGFTMAIFIAGLAFTDASLAAAAKVGVFVASGLAGVLGVVIGRMTLPERPEAGAATTVEEAEAAADR